MDSLRFLALLLATLLPLYGLCQWAAFKGANQ
jgi:hypothetical protein